MSGVLGIVPARGGSKRIKNKNIVDFFGRPIIAYSLEAMRGSGVYDEIHVSTDSAKIRAIATGLGFNVPFLRDMYADDHTGLLDVVRWVVDRFEKEGRSFADIGLMMPCAPTIEAEDLKTAFDAYLNGDRRPLLAVATPPAPPQQSMFIDPDGFIRPEWPDLFKERSQDLPETVHDTGTFLFFTAKSLHNGEMDRFEGWRGHLVDRQKAIDINTPEDLEFARTVYAGINALRDGG